MLPVSTCIFTGMRYLKDLTVELLYGSDNLIEENNISRVMQEMHDGAAIYNSGTTVF
jgi:hypothetical protein